MYVFHAFYPSNNPIYLVSHGTEYEGWSLYAGSSTFVSTDCLNERNAFHTIIKHRNL